MWIAQESVHVGSEYLYRRSLHDLSGQPVPVLCHPQSKEDFSHIQILFPAFQFMSVAYSPVAGHHQKEPIPILLTLAL